MAADNRKPHKITLLLFGGYLILLFYFLFFSEAMGRTGVVSEYHYNLHLFKEIGRFIRYRDILGWEAVFLNIFGNIIAFMPFGFFMPRIVRKYSNIWYITLCSAEFSLFVEICQLVLKIGSFDVDDILLNTIGGFVGYLCYFLMEKIRSNYHDQQTKKKKSF